MRVTAVVFLAGLVATVTSVHAQITVYYQPTPYPDTVSSSIHHIVDGWITNVFYDEEFIRDDRLRVGGWGDIYHAYAKFDLRGLPANVTQAKFWLRNYPAGGGSTLTPFAFCSVAESWNPSMVWDDQPTLGSCTSFNPGTESYWWIFNITSLYQSWQNGAANNGIMMYPLTNDNRFNAFRSSHYVANRGERPILQLVFNQPVATPAFKMPLPGEIAWLVTTEVGGWDCKGGINGQKDEAHDGTNYFSIDFSWRNIDPDTFTRVYSESDNIPVLAAASGTVLENRGGDNHPNGYYVVLQHAGGFTTRYLHLKERPPLVENVTTVTQGDQIGIMGTTGCCDANGNPTSTGVHLHFGVRYNGSGSATQTALRAALLDGRLLKSYQTECKDNLKTGDYIMYYTSHNRVYR